MEKDVNNLKLRKNLELLREKYCKNANKTRQIVN